jgi:maltose O-acetyltransferase
VKTMFGSFWRRRQKPVTWRRRIKVWAKRLYHAPALLRMAWRVAMLRRRGAQIGALAFIGDVRIEGSPAKLKVGEEASLGRCEIALHADVTIGRRAVINDGAVLLTATHSLRDPRWGLRRAPIRIGDYAWIAQGAILLPGVSVGPGAVVGAGAVVREDVPAYALAIGNPAAITPNRRITQLEYSPVGLTALFEAWLGQPDVPSPSVETAGADSLATRMSNARSQVKIR